MNVLGAIVAGLAGMTMVLYLHLSPPALVGGPLSLKRPSLGYKLDRLAMALVYALS